MNSVDRVKSLCKERKIPISRLEKDLGYANGYIGQLRKGVFPTNRLSEISEYLHVPFEYLMNGTSNSEQEEVVLTQRDQRDIAKDLDRIMMEIRKGDNGPLYYNGVEIDKASISLLENAIEFALKETKIENKVKYNPHKNKSR